MSYIRNYHSYLDQQLSKGTLKSVRDSFWLFNKSKLSGIPAESKEEIKDSFFKIKPIVSLS